LGRPGVRSLPFPAGRRHALRGLAVSQSYLLAFVQQMGAEHDDAVARRDAPDD
jgi:hypothetical protein